MSTFIDSTEQQQQSSITSSCCTSIIGQEEQLQESCWPEPAWWQTVGMAGTSSCLEDWQQLMPLDEGCCDGTLEEVELVKEPEIRIEQLEQVMSASMWEAASITAAQGVQSRFCQEEPLDEGEFEMSPTYELQLQMEEDDLVQEQILPAEDYEPQEQAGQDLEPLSGSWIDTTSYIDHITSLADSSDSSFVVLNTCSIEDGLVSSSNSLLASSSLKLDEATDQFIPSGSSLTLGNSTAVVEEVSDVAAEEVTKQLFEQLKVIGQQLCSEGGGSPALDSISGVEFEELVAQMFGGVAQSHDDQECTSALEEAAGSTVDTEVLWDSDSGYQMAASVSSSISEALLTPDSPEMSIGCVEDVVTQQYDPASLIMQQHNYKPTNSVLKLAGRKYKTNFKWESSTTTSSMSDDDDYDDDGVDDDDVSDEDFVPATLHGRSVGAKRRRRCRTSAGKRKRREEYALLTPEERRERKREQNKNAATKYREKKRMEEMEKEDVCDELERKNMELRKEVTDKEREVKVLRRLIINIFRQQPGGENMAEVAMPGKKRNLKKELLKMRLQQQSMI